MKDHSEIEGIIRDVTEAVDTALVSTHPDVTDIGDKLSTLIIRERSHLLFEEMNIYPYIAEHLSNEDWENISALIPDYEDPIFGDKVRNLRVPSSKGFSIGIWTTTHRQISS